MKYVGGFDRFYKVSENGQVWSCHVKGSKVKGKRGPWIRLRGTVRVDGYVQMCLRTTDGQKRLYLLHNLVLSVFREPKPDDMECRHLNGDRSDNRLGNLAWGTTLENSQDCTAHGTRSKGVDRWNAKLSPELVERIRALYATGTYSQSRLGVMFGVTQTTIRSVVLRKSWA